MKAIVKGTEPSELGEYRTRMARRPSPPKWKDFKTDATRSGPVRSQLFLDQGGICAYCEINLVEGDQTVEHFVPAHKTTRDEDWDLEWSNLLLACKGGTDSSLQDEGEYRYAAPPDNESCCGFHKGGSESEILNPLHIDPYRRLFQVGLTTGKLIPDESSCHSAGVDPALISSTIGLLNLNCRRLSKNRLAVINGLLDESAQHDDENMASVHLKHNSEGCWPAFFSTYRFFLGEAAETHLADLTCYP